MQGLIETLFALVDEFLLFSKLRNGTHPSELSLMTPAAFKVCDLLAENRHAGAPLAQRKQLDFVVDCDPNGLDVLLQGPVKSIKRVLGNLVSNAITYTDSGSVTVSAHRVHNDESDHHDDDMVAAITITKEVVVEFAVTDTGRGMSKSDQSKVWSPYKRGGETETHPLLSSTPYDDIQCAFNSTTQSFTAHLNANTPRPTTASAESTSGAGLGLWISRQLVKELGGTLELRSTLGKGTSFFFTLTLALDHGGADDSDARKGVKQPTEEPGSQEASPDNRDAEATKEDHKRPKRKKEKVPVAGGHARPLRILIVDDEETNVKLLGRVFVRAAKKLGVETPTIDTAKNGQEALDLVQASFGGPPDAATIDAERGDAPRRAPFNLVCLDRQMPVMDGVEAARRIKAAHDDQGDSCVARPYVVGMSASIESSDNWVVDELIPKPIDVKKLTDLLHHLHLAAVAATDSEAVPGTIPRE